MKNFRAVLATHNTPALRKFVRESNLSTRGLKRAEIIDLMEKHYTRFTHIKPATDRYKRKPKDPDAKPKAKKLGKMKLKKPTLVAPKQLQANMKFKAHYDPFLTKSIETPLMTPMTPFLKTPKTPLLKPPKPRNPLRDVQFKSMY